MELAEGELKVEVLNQRFQTPYLSESRALDLPLRQWAVIREVVLHGKGIPWVYARTVIPLSTLKGPLRRLYYLGNRPLGGELFKDPTMRRDGLQLAAIKPIHLPAHAKHLQPVWGRRSLFLLQGKPLLVAETFLDNLLQ